MKKVLLISAIALFVIASSFMSSCNDNNENQVSADISKYGCVNQGVSEKIGDCKLFAPNIFTPNSDGLNDRFTVLIIFSDSTNYQCSLSVTITHIELGTVHTFQTSISDADHAGGSWQQLAIWDGRNSDNQIVTGVYQYEIFGTINGIDFNYFGELTLISERTFLEQCRKCEPLISSGPAIDCAD